MLSPKWSKSIRDRQSVKGARSRYLGHSCLCSLCVRRGGLIVSTLDSGSSGPASSAGLGHFMLCSWARHLTLTVPLFTQEYEWVQGDYIGENLPFIVSRLNLIFGKFILLMRRSNNTKVKKNISQKESPHVSFQFWPSLCPLSALSLPSLCHATLERSVARQREGQNWTSSRHVDFELTAHADVSHDVRGALFKSQLACAVGHVWWHE